MESLIVADYMNKRPVTFYPDVTIAMAVQKFINSSQIGGPVIDANKHVLGWVSEQDCLRAFVEETYHCEQVAQVADVMRKDVLTLTPNHNIMELAQAMLGNKPKMYPVVEEDVLVGVITRHHVLKAISENLNACFHT